MENAVSNIDMALFICNFVLLRSTFYYFLYQNEFYVMPTFQVLERRQL